MNDFVRINMIEDVIMIKVIEVELEEVADLETFVVIPTGGEEVVVVVLVIDRVTHVKDLKVIALSFDPIEKKENGSKIEGENEEDEYLSLMSCLRKNRLHWKNCKKHPWRRMGLIRMYF
jgi:hypothetical protein